VIAGVLCAVLIPGALAPILAFALIGLGGVVLTSLVFLEVGLSEDRARARAVRREAERDDRRKGRSPTRDRAGDRAGPRRRSGPGTDKADPDHPVEPRPGRLPPPRRFRLDRSRGRRRRLR
jgi:hypothetical protein